MEPSLGAQYDDPSFRQRRLLIVERMKKGGYWKKIMGAGREMDRVREFLSIIAEDEPRPEGRPAQNPRFLPVFPGIGNAPFHDPSRYPWVKTIEGAFPAIREEMDRLSSVAAYIDYSPEIKGQGTWEAFPFYFMGLKIPNTSHACPRTVALLEGLPRCCRLYPWADMLFSKHSPGTHLVPHCSIDAFRLRCHLGLLVPEGSTIRVGSETKAWEEGKAILFEDSFEHETWNRSASPRIVLIVDFWHPDFTEAEIRALTAGFRKSEVRALMYDIRLHGTPEMKQQILQSFVLQDQEDVIREYWD